MESKRQRHTKLTSQLRIERDTFLPAWRELGDFILPRRPRFLITDVNRGDRRNQKIIDTTATLASRTQRSGMMSGITSPARPWFRLTTPDPGMADYGPIKEWLHTVGQRMATTFLQSNLYQTLPTVYGDMGVFGTAAMMLEEDFDKTVRFFAHPIGSYMIANDHKLRVNTFIREFRMTVRQLIQMFGEVDQNGKPDWSKFSTQVRSLWDAGNYQAWVDVVHVIEPNDDYDPTKLHSKYKKFSSSYFERGSSEGYGTEAGEQYLREKGYDYFPVLCPRWEVTGEDVYGTDCPGITAIGDVKALQTLQKRKAQAIEKMINPAMVGPTSLRTSKASILPGDITYSDEREGQKGFRPAHEVTLSIQELLLDIQDHQKRISRAFYEDLFLMLAQSDRRDITAREIDERHEEKLLALGPVLEQLNQDLLDPLIDNTFNIMLRQSDFKAGTGPIPKPPDELAGMDLKIEYISQMAQAQKLIGISGVERFFGFANSLVTLDQGIGKKVNTQKALENYAEMTSIPPGLVRDADEVAKLEQQEAQAQQAQSAAAMVSQAAGAARDLSQTSLEGDNALKRVMDQANAGGPA